MGKRLLFLSFFVAAVRVVAANGVVVVDAEASEGEYLRLQTSDIDVAVEGQVAVVTTTQAFRNHLGETLRVKYAFPLPEGASATALSWNTGDGWREAVFVAAPQDTTLPGTGGPGGSVDPALSAYLGPTPLYFEIDETVAPDEVLTVRLVYVQLLPYAFGAVDFRYPNNYAGLQPLPLERQTFRFTLTSPRTITSIDLLSHTPSETGTDGGTAYAAFEHDGAAADADIRVQYRLSTTDLGLFSFSTFLPDSAQIDDFGRGYFTFIAEPDPQEQAGVIQKVFTFIIDRSGSMTGEKIVQARNAARFIVSNLNEGDRFNIISFSDAVRSFRPEHVPYTAETRDAALAYIDGLTASGTTNIAGAFEVAIPQFAVADDRTANLIVFFTDGVPTSGITDTEGILASVALAVAQHETEVAVYNFGVGPDVNRQLLTLLASEYGGFAAFLENDELEARITDFYLQIRNPVLLNTQLSFSPALVTHTYPEALPSLYQGQQLIVVGRYAQAQPVEVTLSGDALGRPVSFTYTLDLSDSASTRYQFLPKLWAKLKIEELLVAYYSNPADSPAALALKAEITALSVAYGVSSPFTSLDTEDPDDQTTGVEDGEGLPTPSLPAYELLGNYPNPFRGATTIRFEVRQALFGLVLVKIYDVRGRLVHVLPVQVAGPGIYEAEWDGRSASGEPAPAGTYVYVLSLGDAVFARTMMRIR